MKIFCSKSVFVISVVSAIGITAYTLRDNVRFEFLDTDNSGFISANEAKRNADLLALFNDADLNKDMQISAIEFNYAMIR